MFLKQSTEIKVRIGPFVDVGDGFTPETGITLGAADEAEALKANGAATASIAAATWAAVSGADGWYDLTLTTSLTDTVGELVIVVQDDSVCLPVFKNFQVVEESVYANMYAASAVGPLTAAQVNTEADTALTDYDPPTNTEMEARTIAAASYFDPAADTVATVTTVTNQLTAAAIADGVWDEAVAGHVAAGSFGATDAAILADTNELQADDVPGLIAALNDPTAATIADAVWDELLSGHVIVGSTGAALSAAGGSGDPWATALPGAYGAGTAGKIIGDNINAPLDTIDTVVDGIQTDLSNGTDGLGAIKAETALIVADTNELQGDDVPGLIATAQADLDVITGASGVNLLTATQASIDAIETDTGTTLQAELDGIQADTEDIQTQIGTAGAGLTDLGGMSTGMKAEVNAEALDVLNTDTFAESGQGTPAATASLAAKIGYVYKFLRNRVTSNATTISIYNDDATTVDHKSTHSDDGTTYDRGEFTTGP